MNEEIFQHIVEKFKLLHIILLKSKVCNKNDMESKLKLLDLGICVESGYEWMLELIKFNKDIIIYFDTYNKEYCKKYHEDRTKYPNKSTKLPDIYKDFKLYTLYLINEEYEKLENIRYDIFQKYGI